MAAISKYNNFVTNQFGSNTAANFATGGDTIKVMLTTNGYSPSAAHSYKSDVTSEVANGNGYVAGGATITTSVTNSSGQLTVNGTSVTWPINALGFNNAYYAVIYKVGASDATSPLIGYINLGGAQSNQSGSLILNWSSQAGSGAIFTVQ